MATFETINSNTFRIAGLGSVGADILLGGTDIKKFIPNINESFKFESSSERHWWNVNAKNIIITNQKPAWDAVNKIITLTVGDIKEKYFLGIDEASGEQCLKWVRVFTSHPGTNVFEHNLQFSQGVRFEYQGPLTNDPLALDRCDTVTETEGFKDGIRVLYRPAKVVGSYAVYCKDQGHLIDENKNTIVNFRTGKMGMIYPHTFTDADGNSKRGTILIDQLSGILVETIDQDWFLSAKFPVTANAEFGNTNQQSTSSTLVRQDSGYFQAPADATALTAIHACLSGGTDNANCGYYNGTSGDITTHIAHGTSRSFSGSKDFYSWDVSGALTGSNYYWLSVQANYSSAEIFGYYDSSAGNYISINMNITYDTWSDNPAGGTYGTNYIYSIHAVYTAAASTSIEQEGFRARKDDGSESAATFLVEAQDADFKAPLDTNLRIRFLVNTTGDVDTTPFQLEYRKSGDTPWNKAIGP